MKAKVSWQGDLSFSGTADSGFTVPLDAKPEVGGNDQGFRPLELMAVSLAGCTAMDVISILKKKREQVHDFQVEVRTERAEDHPQVFTSAVIEYHVAGEDVDPEAVTRSMELSAVRYCPAQNMLSQVFPIALKYFIYQGKTLEDAEFISEGTYTLADQG